VLFFWFYTVELFNSRGFEIHSKHYKRSAMVAMGLLLAMVALVGMRSNVLESGVSSNEIVSVSSPASLLQDVMRVHPQSEEFANAQDLFQVNTVSSTWPVLDLAPLPGYDTIQISDQSHPALMFPQNCLHLTPTCIFDNSTQAGFLCKEKLKVS
jgi:hypothetical protein